MTDRPRIRTMQYARAVFCGLKRGARIGLGLAGGPHRTSCPTRSASTSPEAEGEMCDECEVRNPYREGGAS